MRSPFRLTHSRSRAALLLILIVLTLVVLLIRTPVVAHGAPGDLAWERTYGPGYYSAWSNGVATDKNGNVYITGSYPRASTGNDIVTMKFAPWGTRRWVRYLSGPGKRTDYANAIAVDRYGNVYVTGSRRLSTGPTFCTIKYDTNGVRKWVASYDGPGLGRNEGEAIGVDPYLNVYVTGTSWSGTTPKNDVLTFKYNKYGVKKWSKRYRGGAQLNDEASDIAVDGSGNSYVALAGIPAGSAYSDYVIQKYTPAGSTGWSRTYAGAGGFNDTPRAIATAGGRVTATGSVVIDAVHRDIWTMSYDATGDLQWQHDSGSGEGEDVAIRNGNSYVCGQDVHLSVLKITSVGVETSTTYETTTTPPPIFGIFDEARAISVDAHENIYVAGDWNEAGEPGRTYLVKFDSSLALQWARDYEHKFGEYSYGGESMGVAVSPTGGVYGTGFHYGPGEELFMFLIRRAQ